MNNVHGIGVPVSRIEGAEKVTGRAIYSADIHLPNMLIGKLLRSPLPYARIRNIDPTKAEKIKGVLSVVHGGVFKGKLHGAGIRDRYLFPQDRVRYIGEPVAAVAALDEDLAFEALSLIHVDYEPLEPVFDPLVSISPEAPLIHPDLPLYEAEYPGAIKFGNVAMWTQAKQGNIDKGLAKADLVFVHSFTTPTTHAGFIEPHASIVQINPSNRVTGWSSTQQPFLARAALSDIFGLDENDVQIIVPNIGGGFGGKEGILLEPYCYLLALKSGFPIKMVMTREEELQGGYTRHASHIDLTTGVTRDGKFVARKAKIIYDTGAYASQGPYVAACGALSVFGPYRIEHRFVEALCVYTNKPVAGAYRAYGFPQAAFASEAQVDLIASDLGIDPIDLRKMNAAKDGDTVVTGQRLEAVDLECLLNESAKKIDWARKRASPIPNHGIGVACVIKANGLGVSNAIIEIEKDGSATIFSGTVDLGTGSTTVLAQIVAEEFGIPDHKIKVCTADTRSTPYDEGSVASRVAFGMNAILQACQEIKRKLSRVAADYWDCSVDEIIYDSQHFIHSSNKLHKLSFEEIAYIGTMKNEGPILGIGKFDATDGKTMDMNSVKGFPMGPISHFVFATQMAEVEVDPDLGDIKILRIVAAHDVGRALNPINVLGQIEGGVVMGLSAALYEQMIFRNGIVLNSNFADFKIPTAVDCPEIIPIVIENPYKEGPYGAKGMGESPVISTAPAIANAIYNAVGIMIHDLPITAEKIAAKLEQKSLLSRIDK